MTRKGVTVTVPATVLPSKCFLFVDQKKESRHIILCLQLFKVFLAFRIPKKFLNSSASKRRQNRDASVKNKEPGLLLVRTHVIKTESLVH